MTTGDRDELLAQALTYRKQRNEAREALRELSLILGELTDAGVVDLEELRANEDEVRRDDGSWPEGWDAPVADRLESALEHAGQILKGDAR